ncbi:MAG: shikimate kinase [Chloroflexota bacterium]
MKTNIALIGFMGTGKTAVGQALARRLGKALVETDALIVQQAGKPIPDIFAQDGEIAFREMEIAVIKDVAAGKDQVIACGGGVVLNKINVDRLRESGVVVCLTASPGTILRRTAKDANGRPLLVTPDRAGRVGELLRYRRPYYQRAADITINTTRLGIEAVADKIVSRLGEHAGNP